MALVQTFYVFHPHSRIPPQPDRASADAAKREAVARLTAEYDLDPTDPLAIETLQRFNYEPREFEMVATTAPEDYDGFGTFTAGHHGPLRVAAIEPQHVHWQTMRYRSGVFVATPMDDPDLDYIAQMVAERGR